MPFHRIVVPILCIAPFAALAQTPPDLSGIWEVNKEKTTFRGAPPERMRFKIEQRGSNLTFTMRVVPKGIAPVQQTLSYTIAEESKNQMHGAPMTSRADWKDATLVVRSIAKMGDKELRLTDRWSLAADGKQLMWSEAHQFGDEAQAEELYVFDRTSDSSWEPDAPAKNADEVYKNIQMLKGVPSDRVMMAMNFFTTSLGVRCEFCHVMGALDKDDKSAKVTAREMWKMANKINADNFKGAHPISCWTCHRGQSKPQTTPPQ